MEPGRLLFADLPMNLWILSTATFLLQLATSVVLVFSGSVNDFLYKQAN